MTDLDPKLTFDSFVVGPANRLASAAARRAAESPGSSYNPLFFYSASGLGKSHILNAVAHHVLRAEEGRSAEYMTLENYLGELTDALERGEREAFRERFVGLSILLLDDIQFLAGQAEAQEMLLRTLDDLSKAGSQIVLASDRAPAEIDSLDARLLSRFAGGLIVDIAAPEFETRVAIIRRKAAERGQELDQGVAEAIARAPFRNVRELGGALNKVFATQDLEERKVGPEEIPALVGTGEASSVTADEFGSFMEDLTESLAETVQAKEAPWRKAFRDAVDAAEREGFVADRLASHQGGEEPEDWTAMLETFQAELQRLREIEEELEELENPWPEAAQGLLRDPDRLEEAETLLTSVQERQRPFPRLGPGPGLSQLDGVPTLALRAARQLVTAEKPEYNPLYLWSDSQQGVRSILGAAGRSFQTQRPDARMAVTSVEDFAQDFIRALGEGVAGAWRERWWTVDLLLVHGVEALSDTERAQDEFFHLFEALKRRGARVFLAADRPPAGIEGIDERLRSRFEGGLVLDVEVQVGRTWGDLTLVAHDAVDTPTATEAGSVSRLWDDEDEVEAASEPVETAPEAPGEELVEPTKGSPDDAGGWYPSRENVVIHWPELDRLLVEELE